MKKLKLFTIQPIPKLILASDQSLDIWERIKFYLIACAQFAPVAFFLNLMKWWFYENQQFASFMLLVLFINMVVGVVSHIKKGTFSFRLFLLQNALIIFVCSCVYTSLETLRYTVGDNIAGDLFRSTIQSMTLGYPISKILKNIFLLTNGQFPAEWLMRKLYNFEKNGDLKKFFDNSVDGKDDGFEAHIKDILKKEKINEN
ncbi:MAG TPA: hypothetical protein PKA53_08455 [Sphingobacterium sp.]|nr:hypothetical protein [Sphingobacterium sp.]